MSRLIAGCLLFFAGFAHSQNVTFEAFKIADLVMAGTWKNSEENILPAIIQKIEADLKAGSATDKAAKVMSEEMRKAFCKDNLTRAVAQIVSTTMSIEEQKQALGFFQSAAGQKYLAIAGGGNDAVQFLLPIVKQACSAANAQLGFFERGSLNGFCGRL